MNSAAIFYVRRRLPMVQAAVAWAALFGLVQIGNSQVTIAPEKEWDGSSSTDWSTNQNWTSVPRPKSNEGALFDSLGVARTSAVLTGDEQIAGFRFGAGATVSYDISGDSGTRTLTLGAAVPYILQQSAQDQAISAARLALGASSVIEIMGAGNLTVSSGIYSATSLSKDGSGTGKLILSGNNSFLFGNVLINTGALQAAHTNALGNGSATIANGAALELSGGITPANAVTVTGSGLGGTGAIRSVSGANTLSGTLTQTGATTIGADAASTLNLTGNLTGPNTATTLVGAGNINVARISTGTAGVTLDGSGTVTFNGGTANTYTGTTTVNSGTLVLAKTAGTTALAGNVVVGDGTGTDTLRLGASNQIADTATVTVNNGGFFNLNGQAETISVLAAASSGATVGLGAGTLTISSAANSSYAGTITGTGALVKSGSGQLLLSGASTYTGGTNVTGGTLALASSERLSNVTAVTVGTGATFDLAGHTETVGSIAGDGSILIGTGQLIAGGDNTDTTFGGTITGLGDLTKAGTGTLVVTSNLGFAGDLVVAAGTLQFNLDNAFASVTLSGGTLRLSNSLLAVNSLHITGNTTIDFVGATGILDVANLTIEAGVTLTITNWQDAADFFYAQNFNGAVQNVRGLAPLDQIRFNPPAFGGNDTIWLPYNDQITPVPEPSTYGAILMGAGLALFGWRRWRQERAAKV